MKRVFSKAPLFLLIIIILGFLPALNSCAKKGDPILLGGTVESLNEGKTLEDVKVELYTRKLESGIFNANYLFFDSTRTDIEGRFHFEIEDASWFSFILYFSKSGYYNWDHEMDGDVIRQEGFSDEVYSMDPKSWVEFIITNLQDSDGQDVFEMRLLNGTRNCEDCCSGEKLIYRGKNIHENWICQLTGHQEIIVQWSKVIDENRTGGNDMYFVPAGDTVKIEYYY